MDMIFGVMTIYDILNTFRMINRVGTEREREREREEGERKRGGGGG